MGNFLKALKNILPLSSVEPTSPRSPSAKPSRSSSSLHPQLRLVSGDQPTETQNFDAILVRVELTSHTQMFLEKKSELFCPILNDYFSRAHDLIQRYGGILHQQMGEEIIFYFRDESPGTAAIALACVRSLAEMTQKIENSISVADEPHFKIKASLVPGILHQLNLESGTVIAGLPFIESTKLLSHFDEKSKSVICFYSKSHHGFSFLCDADVHKTPVMRKLSDPVSAASATRFRDLQSFLVKKNFQAMAYFRGDEDLQHLLQYFSEHLSFENEESFNQAFRIVRTMHLKTVSPELLNAAHEMLKTAIQRNSQKWVSDRSLASAITLLRHIVPPGLASDELLATLNQALEHTDARICANTIAALGDLRENSLYLKNYIRSSNNRVCSEALLAAGKENLTSVIVDKIVENSLSPDPLHQASATYVSESLLSHYRSLDEEFFAESKELRRLEQIRLPQTSRRAA